MIISQLDSDNYDFPNPNLANEDGIVAFGGDLNPLRLISAYQSGIFPWYSKDDPILWWSPNPRLIMELEDFKLSHSLKKSIKKFEYKMDTNFTEVMRKCATTYRPNQHGTWIQDDLIKSFEELHNMGIAHSIEAYQDGKLVGGLYGLTIGNLFCGESMFSHVSDASKSAFAMLVKHLKEWGYDFIDCQVPTAHLTSLGAKEVSRDTFLLRLKKARKEKTEHSWEINKDL